MNFAEPNKMENREYLVLKLTKFRFYYEILNQREKIHVFNTNYSRFKFKLKK